VSEPRWVRVIALGAALALASFGAVGLLLADLGWYKPWLVLVLGLAGLAGLLWWARRILHVDGEVNPVDRACAIAAVALSAITALWNGTNAAKHAQIDRDGGLYLNAGKWIAAHGTLHLMPFTGPFAPFGHSASVVATSTGMKQRGFHLEFDLSHMLSAVLAEAQNLGGNRLMFLTVPLLSGVALLAFYLLALRLLQQPLAALGATGALALLMPQINFSRDSTTEIPIQILLFTAMWLLFDRRTLRTAGPAFSAGLLLGLVQAMHVDGLAFLVGLPAVYAISWLHANRAARKHLGRGILWSVAGIAVGMLFGAIDLVRWDRYYLSIVSGNVERLAAVGVLMTVAAIAIVLLARRTNLVDAIQHERSRFAIATGVVVVIGGFLAWFVRPMVQHVHAGPNTTVGLVQRLNGLAIDPTKRYSELSVHWIAWYVGPITLTLAIIGAAGVAVCLVRGTLRLPTQIATFMLAPPALLYIWRPTITPDQIWAARRFLPAVFPAVILLAFGVICALTRGWDEKYSAQRRSFAVVLAVAVVAFPWFTIRNVSQMTDQRDLYPVITATCKLLGHQSAVVMVQEPHSSAWLSDPQTLRSFCNVPVVVMLYPVKATVLHSLAAQWKQDGRTLFVVAEYPQRIRQLFPHARVRGTPRLLDPHVLEQTLTRRPSRYAPGPFQVTVAHQLSVAPVPMP
jgi:hypothetical protein